MHTGIHCFQLFRLGRAAGHRDPQRLATVGQSGMDPMISAIRPTCQPDIGNRRVRTGKCVNKALFSDTGQRVKPTT